MKRALLPLLTLVLACGRPEAAPGFDQSLAQAAAASEARQTASRQPGYREGFLNGARMVEEARKAGRRPYMLRLGGEAPAPRGAGPLPPGATVVAETAVDVEVDEASGLEIRRVPEGFTGGFGLGQVEGFRWALERNPGLVRPRPKPSLPARWVAPLKEGEPMKLDGAHLDVLVLGRPGVLAWSIHERGFPVRRFWRPVPDDLQPKRAGLAGDAFWIDTTRGGLALDLETGAIRAVEATLQVGEHPELETLKDLRTLGRPHRRAEGPLAPGEAELIAGWDTDDMVQRADLFRQAAAKGSREAMFELGTLHFQGRGVPLDKAASKAWFQKALALGHPQAKEVLEGLFP